MRTLILTSVLLALGLPARAAMERLPVELPLELQTVVFDLRDDRIEVVVDEQAEPVLRILDAVSGPASEGFVSMEVDEKGGVLRVLRPHGDALTAPPLRIELVISRAHALELLGEGFDATVEDPFIDDDSGPAVGGEARYSVRADDARVRFRGVSGIEIRGRGSSFNLETTASPLAIALDSGSVELEQHVGDVRVTGEGTDISLRNSRANVRADLSGGSLEARQGAGRIDANVSGGVVRAEAWEGSISVKGEAGFVEILEAGSEDSLLRVDGIDHTFAAEGFRGGVIAKMTGGSARLKNIGQRVQLTAEDATRIELDTVGGKTDLRLSAGATAGAARLVGELEARVEDGEITAEEVRDLDVHLMRSRAELASQQGRAVVRAVDSDVSLNLEAEGGHSPNLEALGSSQIQVSMREPCAITLKGDEEMADMIDAGGCDLRVSGRRSRSRGVPGPMTLVTAKVAPGAYLEISSR